MFKGRLSRRTALRGMGAAIALPWLECMTPARSVLAGTQAADKGPLRLLFFNVPNGIRMSHWTPESEGRDFELPPILSQLADFREQLTVLTGLTLDGAHAHGDGGGDHARSGAAFLTGAHPRKTDGADIQNALRRLSAIALAFLRWNWGWKEVRSRATATAATVALTRAISPGAMRLAR